MTAFECSCGCRWHGRYAVENAVIYDHIRREGTGTSACRVTEIDNCNCDVCRAQEDRVRRFDERRKDRTMDRVVQIQPHDEGGFLPIPQDVLDRLGWDVGVLIEISIRGKQIHLRLTQPVPADSQP